MTMPILRVAAILTAAALGLSACGVRGEPEPPPGAEAVTAPAGQEQPVVEAPVAAGAGLDIYDDDDEDGERVIQSQRRTRYPPMSDSFVLDPLL